MAFAFSCIPQPPSTARRTPACPGLGAVAGRVGRRTLAGLLVAGAIAVPVGAALADEVVIRCVYASATTGGKLQAVGLAERLGLAIDGSMVTAISDSNPCRVLGGTATPATLTFQCSAGNVSYTYALNRVTADVIKTEAVQAAPSVVYAGVCNAEKRLF